MSNEKKPTDEASEKACKKIREVFDKSLIHPLKKHLDYSKDDVVIEDFTDEWTWYMQGWKDENELTENLKFNNHNQGLKIMSQMDELLSASNKINSLQSTLTTVTAERDRMREALKELQGKFVQGGHMTGGLWDICTEALSQSEKGENGNAR